jgi:hypothetical protein
MRLLLDENFPASFAKQFSGFEVQTIHRLGWAGMRNGALMRNASAVCEVFLTLDQNLEFQQNIQRLSFGVVVVIARSNRVLDLLPVMPAILDAVRRVRPGNVLRAGPVNLA